MATTVVACRDHGTVVQMEKSFPPYELRKVACRGEEKCAKVHMYAYTDEVGVVHVWQDRPLDFPNL